MYGKTTKPLVLAAAACLATAPSAAQSDITWTAGSGVWSAPGNWTPANTPDTASENAIIPGVVGRQVALNLSVSINALDVGPGSSLSFDPGRFMSLAADLRNDGFITLNPTNNTANAFLQFNSNATLSGSGILRLSGGDNDARLVTNGTVITNALGHTIDGAGEIPATLINNGVITALPTGFGSRLELVSGAKTNNLTMQAADGAELRLTNVTVTQGPDGIISPNSGGLVSFNGTVTVTDGRLIGAGEMNRIGNGSLNLTDVVIGVDIPVQPGSHIVYSGPVFDCSNTITLNDTGSAADGFIQFNSSATLTGGGTIFMAGSGNDSRVVTNGTTITLDPTFTIEGSGELPATLINNGLIRAFPSTFGDGVIRVYSGLKTNNTELRADTGGTLRIENVTIVNGNDAAQINADGGLIEFNGTASIAGGRIRTVNGGTLNRIGNGSLNLTDVVLDADLPVQPGSQVVYNGDEFDLRGLLTLNSTASTADAFIQFNSNATLTGGGTIFLAGSGNDSRVQTNGTTITIDPSITVEGSGEIPATLVNNGLVRAFPSEFGDGRIRLYSGAKTNNTQIVADPGGTLTVENVTVNQAPAAELLADGGLVEFNGSPSINGGTIRTANGGTLNRIGNGSLNLTDVVLDADLPVQPGSQIIYNGGEFDLRGTLTLNDTASTADAFIQFNSSATLTGGGTIFLAGSGNDSRVLTNGTTVTLDPTFTIEGSGEIPATLVNDGLIRAFPSEFGDGRIRLYSGVKTNNTQIVADPGGTLTIENVTISQDAGAELLADGGLIEFSGNPTVNGGTIRTINGGTLNRVGNGSLAISNITLEGELPLQPGSNLQVNSDSFINNGAILVNPTTNAADAFIQFNANTNVTGTGRIELGGGGNDSRINTNGTVVTYGPGQTVMGEGQIFGAHVFEGRLEPGLPVGEISGTGVNLTLAPSSVFAVEADSETTADRLAVSGTVNLGGTLSLEGIGGYVPALLDEWTVISASTINGAFDSVQIVNGGLPTGLRAIAVYEPGVVILRVVCDADLNGDGILDLSDITFFTSAFVAQDPSADLAEPLGVWDLADLNAFVASFLGTCN